MLDGRHLPSRRAAPCVEEAGRARRRRAGAPVPRAGRRVLWMEPARPPRPQTQRLARWVGRKGAAAPCFCLRPKIVGCGRLPGWTGSLPDALQPAGFFSFDLGLDGLVLQPRPRAGFETSYSVPLVIGVRIPAFKAKGRAGVPSNNMLLLYSPFYPFMFSWLYCKTVWRNTWIRLWERDGCK